MPCVGAACDIRFVLQNSVSQAFDNRTVEPFNVTCRQGAPYVGTYSCLSGHVVHVNCSGQSIVHQGRCPPTSSMASCKVLEGQSSTTCRLVHFTATNTTCICSLSNTALGSRRLSSDAGNDSLSLNIVNMLETVAVGAESTILSAQDLNGDEIAKEWTVLAALGGLASAILILMLLGHKYDMDESRKISAEIFASKAALSKGMLGKSDRKGGLRRGAALVPLRIEPKKVTASDDMAVLEEALPQVLNGKKSVIERIRNEIVNHHRWIAVFCRYSETFPRSLRVLSLATNIIVMLFIQSITYNLSNPDDGTCQTYTTSASCTQPKSSFSNGANKCKWTPASSGDSSKGTCSFIEPSDSISTVLFVAMFSAVVSVPIAVFLHKLIQNLLAAPNIQQAGNDESIIIRSRKSTLFAAQRSNNIENESRQEFEQLQTAILEHRKNLNEVIRSEFDGNCIF